MVLLNKLVEFFVEILTNVLEFCKVWLLDKFGEAVLNIVAKVFEVIFDIMCYFLLKILGS